MNAAQIFTVVISVMMICALALAAISVIGDLIAFYERITRERRWQQWKRKNLTIPPLKRK